MSEMSSDLGNRLLRQRERLGLSQEELGHLLGQPRTVISNWETGERRPNSAALAKLAVVFRTPLDELLGVPGPERPALDVMLLRAAEARELDGTATYEVERFVGFLDDYADLLDLLNEPPGLLDAPFTIKEGFTSKEDVRRRAEEARRFLRLGPGPIGDLASAADLAGLTIYHAPLGRDLNKTLSGAFLPHDRVGSSILVNLQTTPGRRQFTLAHEIGHALFHGSRPYVGWVGRSEAAERFADQFASEFLVPTATLRAVAESLGHSRVRDADTAVHLQRYFRVSYAMILVRLRAARLSGEDDVQSMRKVQPVHVANRLGYSTSPDEWTQDPDMWGFARFPKRFLQLLARAFDEGVITLSGAAAMTGLSDLEIERALSNQDPRQTDIDDWDILNAST